MSIIVALTLLSRGVPGSSEYHSGPQANGWQTNAGKCGALRKLVLWSLGHVLRGLDRRLLFDCVIGSVFACRLERVVGCDVCDWSGKHMTDSTARSIARSGQCRQLGVRCSTFMSFRTEAS